MSNTAINHDNTLVKGGCSENSDALRCKFVVSYSEKKYVVPETTVFTNSCFIMQFFFLCLFVSLVFDFLTMELMNMPVWYTDW